jgi:hypothetical protein
MKLPVTPRSRGLLVLAGLASIGLFTTWMLVYVLFPVSQTEMLRRESPSGKVTAVLVELHSGNSPDYGYDVFLEQKSLLTNRAKVASFYRAYRRDNSRGIDVDWLSPDVLRLQWSRAEITSHPKSTAQCGSENIKILLQQDPSPRNPD